MKNNIFVDSHVHVMPRYRLGGLARWILKAYPDHPVTEDVTKKEIVSDLSKAGVTHFFNFIYPIKKEETDKLNQFNWDFCQETPGAIPFASMHQDTPDKAKTAEKLLKTCGFAGFKFHPFVQRFDPWDQRMEPLYEFLQEVGKPAFFHTGFEDFYNMKMPVKELEKMVKKFPKLTIVFVHMAFPELSTVFRMLDDYPELYLDATNVLSVLRPEYKAMIDGYPNGQKILDSLVEGMEKYSTRIMYGSDHPVGMGGLEPIYQDLEALPISDEARLNIRSKTPVSFISRFLPEYDWSNGLA